MSTEFAALMSREKKAQQPLRLLAADCFVQYWRCFLPGDLDVASKRTAQEAARAAVELSMGGEAIFWNIDFSEANALRTWRLFDAKTKGMAPEPLGHVRTLCLQLTASQEESASAQELMSLSTRLRNDWSFRSTVGFTDEDAEVLGAAHERPRGDFVDVAELDDEWEDSDTEWDLRLKAQTPDLPDFVMTIFSAAYAPRTALPLLRQNLRDLLGSDEAYRAFIKRLERSFDRSQPTQVKVPFPAILKV